ncbi:MAG: DUF1653 domain-containing protein [bacterium]|nr:DUF1653 domain-containing protein [bacterium]
MEETRREREPKAGEFYRHFKNKLYQVLTVAIHSETGEKMVVYQALYGDFKCYVRPLQMFMSEVDKKKYPNATQSYRFERVQLAAEEEPREEVSQEEEEMGQVNPYLLEYLSADTCEEKLSALARMRGHVGQIELDAIAMTLGIQPLRGEFSQQLDIFVKHVRTQQYYDGSRLR